MYGCYLEKNMHPLSPSVAQLCFLQFCVSSRPAVHPQATMVHRPEFSMSKGIRIWKETHSPSFWNKRSTGVISSSSLVSFIHTCRIPYWHFHIIISLTAWFLTPHPNFFQILNNLFLILQKLLLARPEFKIPVQR